MNCIGVLKKIIIFGGIRDFFIENKPLSADIHPLD